jgi:hypothetical protein
MSQVANKDGLHAYSCARNSSVCFKKVSSLCLSLLKWAEHFSADTVAGLSRIAHAVKSCILRSSQDRSLLNQVAIMKCHTQAKIGPCATRLQFACSLLTGLFVASSRIVPVVAPGEDSAPITFVFFERSTSTRSTDALASIEIQTRRSGIFNSHEFLQHLHLRRPAVKRHISFSQKLRKLRVEDPHEKTHCIRSGWDPGAE